MLATKDTVPFLEHDPELAYRWPEAKASEWMEKNGWIVGANFVPSNAINQLEMWQEDTFSPELIDKELGWAADLGFNTVRVFLHHLLWEQNQQGFINRIDQFLQIAYKHNIKTMLVLFDAVWDPFPKLGKQPEPKLNVHNSGWVQCPGYDILNNPDSYDQLHSYVNGIVSHFKDDERVLLWDLFNEPDNMNIASYKDDDYAFHKAELSMALLKRTINWVRVINPIHPITMAPWQYNWSCDTKLTPIDNYMFTHSDIISFHCYEDKEKMEQHILSLQRFGRPMMCTEFMARPFQSTFEDILPVLKKYNVGAYCWGLVAGKTQTHCPWDSWTVKYNDEPEVWFHDIFRPNGEPYIKEEVEFLREITKKQKEHQLLRVA
ncbi:MAG TPA: cellulase family glycosylhydrolase [Flavisolibacter sp.]|nr:cellulase family glycosylhydrolase [Flavisolibacter sp.]